MELIGKDNVLDQEVAIKKPVAMLLSAPEKEHRHLSFVYFASPKEGIQGEGVAEQYWVPEDELQKEHMPFYVTKYGLMALKKFEKLAKEEKFD